MYRTNIEEEEKQEVVELIRKQMRTERELIGMYEKTIGEVESRPVKRILHMIQVDSKKHIDILQASIEIIQGEDILKEDKRELSKNLKNHLELEKESIEIANRVLGYGWIRENRGLSELIKSWRDDEKRHHKAQKQLSKKTYFRISDYDGVALFRDEEFIEKRYRRSKRLMAQ